MAVRFIDAMTDPALFGRWFCGDSWAAWRIVHKAADGLPLSSNELPIFQRLAGGRQPPTHRARELIEICGRRSGKSNTSAARATFEACFRDYTAFLKPGEQGFVVYVANDRTQAKVALGYVRGFFREIPMLARMLARETADEIELSNGITVVVCTNDYRRVRGRTIVCAIFEEAAFYADAESANPAGELYNAVLPGMITIPNALLIAPSTGWRRTGWLFEKFQKSYGTDDPDVLVVEAASRDLNPTLPAAIVDAALAADPSAAAEWLGEFRSDLESYISRDVVEAAVEWGCYERPPRPYLDTKWFFDAAGGSGADSLTLAGAHHENEIAVLDCAREWRPPFSPEGVIEECCELLRSYGVSTVTGDAYAAEWPREQFSKRGIAYVVSDKTRSELYVELLPALNSRRVRLLDNKRLIAQLCALERRAGRSGKDAINHAPGSHDDVINAAAGALVSVAAPTAPGMVLSADMDSAGALWDVPDSSVVVGRFDL